MDRVCVLTLAAGLSIVVISVVVLGAIAIAFPTLVSDFIAVVEAQPQPVAELQATVPGQDQASATAEPIPTPPKGGPVASIPNVATPTATELASPTATTTPRRLAVGLPAPEPIMLRAMFLSSVDSAAQTSPAAAQSTEPAPDSAPGKPIRYTVQDGDTLFDVAMKFGITPETVLWANDISNSEMLLVGQELTILPVSGILHRVSAGDTVASLAEMYAVPAAGIRDVNGLGPQGEPKEGDEIVVPGGIMRTTVVFEAPPSAPSPSDLQGAPRYKVAPGDSLVSIADAYGVLPSAIQSANGLMDPDKLQVGQLLTIPGGKETAPAPARPNPTAPAPVSTAKPAGPTPGVTPPPPPPPTAAPTLAAAAPTSAAAAPTTLASGQEVRYTVKKGDTLFSIARAHGVSQASVLSANQLADGNKIKEGQVLTIVGATSVAAAPSVAPQPTATPKPTQAAPVAIPTPVATKPAPTPTPAPTAAPTPPKPAAAPQPAPAPPLPANATAGDNVASLAQKYLGFRYVWGGHAPTGFDCSGFTWYVYREAGITIPMHDLPGQLARGQQITKDKLLPGDLVFFENTYMKGLSHVGIYLGKGRFINAETEKTGIQIRALSDPYWATRFAGASRPW